MNLASLKRRARSASRDALAARGIELHRTDRGQRHTRSSVLAHYRQLGLAPTTVIDVGVGMGTPDLYQAFRLTNLMLVEPLEEWRGHLEAIAKARPTQIALVAAGPEVGHREITVHRAPICSSLLGSPRGENHPAVRSVPVARLDRLDIAFVQENGRFRSNHAYATPAQADALYRSWGF